MITVLSMSIPATQVAAAPTQAQREERGKLASLWLEAYDEAGIGPSSLLLHLAEVTSLLTRIIEGPSWSLRRAAAYVSLALHDELLASADPHPHTYSRLNSNPDTLC